RVGVGRDPVRPRPRRRQGHRLHDELRRGVRPVRRVRRLRDRHAAHPGGPRRRARARRRRESVTTASWPDHRPALHGATGWLRARGLQPGDRLVTLLGIDTDAFALGLAGMCEGIVQDPLPPDLAGPDLLEVVADADPRLVLHVPAVTADAETLVAWRCTSPAEGGWVHHPAAEPAA